MKLFKLNTSNLILADQLSAYRMAYQKPIKNKEYFVFIGLPGVILGGLLYYLTYSLILTSIGLLIGLIFGWRSLLPKVIYRSYTILSFNERNRMLNLMTQQVSDQSKTPREILERVTKRLNGELSQDFMPIVIKIATGVTNFEIKEMFHQIKAKYYQDIIFVQYMEQLETNFLSGFDNHNTLKDMTIYHNQLRSKRDLFLKSKSEYFKDCQLLIMIFLILITAIEFGFGHQKFVETFSNTLVGKVDSIIYVTLFAIIMYHFTVLFFDDIITEVRIR
ncbi:MULTISPECIES: hypothetical protein [unclassified Enterococcus]|uniref:hypothetical protein n=1 Tax=unclassified Enterococcus TaxID=2608891 RepID=UPI0015574C4C|nr:MULTISPECIES: hypothetical protein [unclassified Enterococcus]MBS7576491.1 hypothetical protein [Enterococcus sp. MMGLQ5-2]MBS7583723.1 hypothetical protein [Enterococcus sp. MMGLQ5-1]NPD11584.1 hypothetical protein [Enterococcus sp. MMGLQ5-1]NPD36328.1 hypothetical protein [Enterococcus sp. MMGLQ5-2]